MEKKFYEVPDMEVLGMEIEGALLAGSGEAAALSADDPKVLYN